MGSRVRNRLHVRALRAGARIAGGEARLRDMLGAPPGAFLRWLEGDEPIPAPHLVRLLELLSATEATASRPPR